MKRISSVLLSAGLLTLSSYAYAIADRSGEHVFDGLYGSLGIGGVQSIGNIKSNVAAESINAVGFALTETNSISDRLNARVERSAAMGNLNIGYGRAFNLVDGWSPFFIAGEFFVNYGKRNVQVTNGAEMTDYDSGIPFYFDDLILETKTRLHLRNAEYGIDFRPGFLLHRNTLLYGRAGVAFNRININSNSDLIATYPTAAALGFVPSEAFSFATTQQSKGIAALRLGVGVEEYICNNMSITLDYVWTDYGRVRTSGSNTVNAIGSDGDILAGGTLVPTATAGAFQHAASAKITNNEVYMSLKYFIDIF